VYVEKDKRRKLAERMVRVQQN